MQTVDVNSGESRYACGMDRTMWTDGCLDDLSRRMDAGFDRVDRDIRDLRLLILQMGSGIVVGLIAVIVTVLVSS